MQKRIRFSKSIELIFTITLLFLLIVVGAVSSMMFAFSLRKEVEQRNVSLVKALTKNVHDYLDHSADHILSLRNYLEFSGGDDSVIKRLYGEVYEDKAHFMKVQIADKEGIVKSVFPYNERFIGIDISRQPYFYKTQSLDNIYWSATFLSPQFNVPVVSINVPYNGGVLSGYLLLDYFKDLLMEIDIGKKSYVSLLDQNGFFIAHTDYQKVLRRTYNVDYADIIKEWTSGILKKGIKEKGEDTEVFVKKVDPSGWTVWIGQDRDETFSAVYKYMFLLISIIFLFGVLSFYIVNRITKYLTNFLKGFIENTQTLAGGNYELAISEERYAEFHDLATHFNQMAFSIKEREQEQRQAKYTIRELKNFLQNIIDSMPSILIGVDSSCNVNQWNKEAEKITGLTAKQAEGKSIHKVFPYLEKDMAKIYDAIINGTLRTIERKGTMIADELYYFDITVYPLRENGIQGAVVRIDDVTERVKLVEMMIQNEKMMSVGGLAAGMAHEINNPLGAVLQGSQNILRRVSDDLPKNKKIALECGTNLESVRKYLTERRILHFVDGIRTSGRRAADIVDNMLQFTRKSGIEKRYVSLVELIEKTIELASNDYNLKRKYDFRHIKIERDYDSAITVVNCIQIEIEQVLLNLLKNAAQALWEVQDYKKDPTIIIRTSLEKEYIQIDVEDNGPGMSAEVCKRVFEPFYTTKQVGSGTGLGLSVSYFIITENHRGSMRVESIHDKGTKFIIYLPIG